MASNKKSVLLYCDIIHTVEELDNEDAGLLFKHYLRYINDLNPEPPSKLIKIVFEPIKQNLKRDLKKWEDKSVKNSEIAKMRWHKEDANACERIKSDANHADKDTVTVKVTDTVTVKVTDTVTVKDKEINTPTLSDFLDYVKKKTGGYFHEVERSATLKYEAWVENGWKDGHDKPIKKWKAKLLNTIPHLKRELGGQKSKIDDTAGNNAAQSLINQIDESINP